MRIAVVALPQIKKLAIERDQLRVRQDELEATTQPPTPEQVEKLQQDLTKLLTNGTQAQRKAIMHTHIAEIKSTGTR